MHVIGHRGSAKEGNLVPVWKTGVAEQLQYFLMYLIQLTEILGLHPDNSPPTDEPFATDLH